MAAISTGAAILGSAALSGIMSGVGAHKASKASNKAAKAQVQASNRAMDEVSRRYEEASGYMNPYLQHGTQSNALMNRMMFGNGAGAPAGGGQFMTPPPQFGSRAGGATLGSMMPQRQLPQFTGGGGMPAGVPRQLPPPQGNPSMAMLNPRQMPPMAQRPMLMQGQPMQGQPMPMQAGGVPPMSPQSAPMMRM